MKFIIEYSNSIEQRLLIYIPEECAFDMKPFVSEIDFELIFNKLSLSVVNNKITQLSGFCGLDKTMKTAYKVPEHRKGILRVKHNLAYRFAYGINEEDLPVYLNIQTGWVCIGNPESTGNAVEFINNCVAVLEGNQLVALWLKPKALPKELYGNSTSNE